MSDEREPDEALPHLNRRGEAHMVDVGDKPATRRVAVAEAFVRLRPETLALLSKGEVKKGDALAVARLAGIAASKRTSELVLLCHPLALSHVAGEVELDEAGSGVRIEVRAETTGPTGVEMEALTAAAVAGLTLYDMLKALSHDMVLGQVRLLRKSGGRSGEVRAEDAGP